MPQVIHLPKENGSQQFQRAIRCEKLQFNPKSESKANQHEKETYSAIQDYVTDFNAAGISTPTSKNIQKRKLPIGDDYDWDWAPYPRKSKCQRNNLESSVCGDSNDYLSDEVDDSQMVPSWAVASPENSLSLSRYNDDSIDSRSTDIRLVNEVVECDTCPESMGNRVNYQQFDGESICFDFGEYCDQREVWKETNEQNEDVKYSLGKLFTLTQMVYDNEEDASKKVEPCDERNEPYESSEDADAHEELQTDNQSEQFKLARCFKCRRKVITMRDCPRHRIQEATLKAVKP